MSFSRSQLYGYVEINEKLWDEVKKAKRERQYIEDCLSEGMCPVCGLDILELDTGGIKCCDCKFTYNKEEI